MFSFFPSLSLSVSLLGMAAQDHMYRCSLLRSEWLGKCFPFFLQIVFQGFPQTYRHKQGRPKNLVFLGTYGFLFFTSVFCYCFALISVLHVPFFQESLFFADPAFLWL